MSRTIAPNRRKAKKSYTLSPETVAFLEMLRSKREAESVSAVLEEILQNLRREQERAAVDRAVAEYYSSLSDTEAEEHSRWGDLALAQFPKEEGA